MALGAAPAQAQPHVVGAATFRGSTETGGALQPQGGLDPRPSALHPDPTSSSVAWGGVRAWEWEEVGQGRAELKPISVGVRS